MATMNPEQISEIKIWETSSICISLPDEKLLRKQFIPNYEKLLSFSGMKIGSELAYRDIEIEKNVYVHEIFTVPPKGSNLPHLVFLHGYGGTSVNAYRLFKKLSKHFQVHAIDRLGEGFSTTSNFSEDFTYEENRAYFMRGIEGWRKAVKLTKFTLVGHSYGGYLACCYADEHPSFVQKLYLLSPAGFTKKYEFDQNRYADTWMTYILKYATSASEKLYNLYMTPQQSLKNCVFGNWTITSMIPNGSTQEQEEAWRLYIRQYMSRETHSQKGFYIFFRFPLNVEKPGVQLLSGKHITFPINFLFGEQDWMCMETAEKYSKKRSNSNFYRIKNAGHKLIFQEPDQICQILIKGLNKKRRQA